MSHSAGEIVDVRVFLVPQLGVAFPASVAQALAQKDGEDDGGEKHEHGGEQDVVPLHRSVHPQLPLTCENKTSRVYQTTGFSKIVFVLRWLGKAPAPLHKYKYQQGTETQKEQTKIGHHKLLVKAQLVTFGKVCLPVVKNQTAGTNGKDIVLRKKAQKAQGITAASSNWMFTQQWLRWDVSKNTYHKRSSLV